MLLRNQGAEVGFSHFHPCLAHVFLQGRVERCSPGHFIITARKDSMKLSQGSKEGCFHKIPLPLLSKHALFYILQLKELFPLTPQSLSFCVPFECWGVWGFSLCSLFIHIYPDSSPYCMWNQASLLCRSAQGLSGTKCQYSYYQMNCWQKTWTCFPK